MILLGAVYLLKHFVMMFNSMCQAFIIIWGIKELDTQDWRSCELFSISQSLSLSSQSSKKFSVKQEIHISYHFTNSQELLQKKGFGALCMAITPDSAAVIWRGSGELMLWAIVRTKSQNGNHTGTCIKVTKIYVGEWLFALDLEGLIWKWAKLESSWSDNLHRELFFQFA